MIDWLLRPLLRALVGEQTEHAFSCPECFDALQRHFCETIAGNDLDIPERTCES